MASLDGPHPISSKLQLRLPVRLARELRIEAGDLLYWRLSDDVPGVLQLIPAEIVERRYAAGERLEALDAETAEELEPASDDSPPVGPDGPFGHPWIRGNFLYVDNSNIWIEGMHVAAVASGLAPDIITAQQAKITDRFTIDFGKLREFAGSSQMRV